MSDQNEFAGFFYLYRYNIPFTFSLIFKRLVNDNEYRTPYCLTISEIDDKEKRAISDYIAVFDPEYMTTLSPDLRFTCRISQLIKLLLDKKVICDLKKNNNNYIKIVITYRLSNLLKKTELPLLSKSIYDDFETYKTLCSTLSLYKDDLVKQNTFQTVRQRLLNIGDLGYFNYLKTNLSDKHSPLINRDDDNCPTCFCCSGCNSDYDD